MIKTQTSLRLTFFALCLYLCFAVVHCLQQGISFNNDLLALLPENKLEQSLSKIDKLLNKNLGQRFLLISRHHDPETLAKSAERFSTLFCNAPQSLALSCIDPLNQADLKPFIGKLAEHQYFLLSPDSAEDIRQRPEKIVAHATARVYGTALSPITSFEDDALGLFERYFQETTAKLTPLEQDGVLTLIKNDQQQLIAHALFIDINNRGFNLQQQARFDRWFTDSQMQFQQAFTTVELLKSGAIFHSIQATKNAKQEITVISSLSIVGIIIIFLLAFASLKPLLLGISSITFGCLSALLLCVHIFSELHLLTLVFGASLIGVSIDYTLHILCKKRYAESAATAKQTLSLLPSLSLGLISSVIGYGILIQAPVPGLQQIAVFSVSGLIASWLFAVVVLPELSISPVAKKTSTAQPYLIAAAGFFSQCWQRLSPQQSAGIIAVLLFSSLLCIALNLSFSDSIRTLYKPEKNLFEQEQQALSLINSIAGNQFFIVKASNTEQLLDHEKQLRLQLDTLVEQRQLNSYLAISHILPDRQTQQQNYHIYQQHIFNSGGIAEQFSTKIGAQNLLSDQLQRQFITKQQQYLTLENLAPHLPQGLDLLFPGKIDQHYFSIVLLRGIHDLDVLQQLNTSENVLFYDKVSKISAALKHQQSKALLQLLIGYLLIAGLVMMHYRKLQALSLLLVPLLASLVTIAMISAWQTPLSLFHIFALFLVLGLGMDYAIFLFDSNLSASPHTLVAILLSAISSILSFGLLSLSSTPMIAAFGLTILLGSLMNFILAPLVLIFKPAKSSQGNGH